MDSIRFIGGLSPESLKDKRIIVRTDFNVPVSGSGKILNHYRVDGAMKTLNYLTNNGAKVILISHIGREKTETLKPVFDYLSKRYKISFISDIFSNQFDEKVKNIEPGEIVLLENLRRWDGEKKNDPEFVKRLADQADIYVNDAFSVTHRDHASITGLPKILNSYSGFLFKEEVDNISKLFDPERPMLVLLGGSKFKTKMPFIEALKDKADHIFVGGALANDVFRQQGYDLNKSLTSGYDTTGIIRMIEKGKVFLPADVIVVNKAGFKKTKLPKRLGPGDKVVDAGAATLKEIRGYVNEAKTVVWNGPFGMYEQGYNYLSSRVIKLLARSKAYVLAGGGDTVTEIADTGVMEKFDFVSMAGGAMLDYISDGTLVGIEALKGN